MYKTTNEYGPAHERCIRWDDPTLKIPWPIKTLKLAKKDAMASVLRDAGNTANWRA